MSLGIEPRQFNILHARIEHLKSSLNQTAEKDFGDWISELLKSPRSNTDETPGFFKKNLQHLMAPYIERIVEADLSIDTLFWIGFYLLCLKKEHYFLSQSLTNEVELSILQERVESHLDQVSLARLRYAENKLPGEIALFYLAKEKEKVTNEINTRFSSILSASERINGWETSLKNWELRLETLKTTYKQAYEGETFEGLATAFNRLMEAKSKEKSLQIASLLIIGACLIFLPTSIIIYRHFFSNPSNLPLASQALKLAPALAVEFLLLYFFKIVLSNYFSTRAQELQLRLRAAMCGFMIGYIDFVKDHRTEKDQKAFDKFDAMMFSGIVADPEKVPNQFDGFERLVEFIKIIKGKD